MQVISLPYKPIPQGLYTRDDLFGAYKSNKPSSWGHTTDFDIYQHYISEGGSTPNQYMGMMQALHDNAITQFTKAFIRHRKVAAIMGDHGMRRDSEPYRDIAILSHRLTRSGILMCSGGGPGAMEASHLGASLAKKSVSHLESELKRLKIQPEVPKNLKDIVNAKGEVNSALVAKAHAWFKPAYEIAKRTSSPSDSLAVPTWDYGHEPTTPFATHIAKYFQNSLREDGLLAIAKQGIVYAEGKAGTIQEIFQDSTQNFYNTFKHFSPMIMFGVEYWTTKYPVVGVLQKLFKPADFKKFVLVTDDVEDAAKFIMHFVPKQG